MEKFRSLIPYSIFLFIFFSLICHILVISQTDIQERGFREIKNLSADNSDLHLNLVHRTYSFENSQPSAPLIDNLELTHPKGGETLSGNVTVEWIYDSENIMIPSPRFSVYYSPDNGLHWIQLANFIEESRFQWDTELYVTKGSEFLIKIISFHKVLGTEEEISKETFSIDNSERRNNNLLQELILLIIIFAVISCFWLGHYLINRKSKRPKQIMNNPQHNTVEFMTYIRNKVIVGLDNIKNDFIRESGDILQFNRTPNQQTMADYFPNDIRKDLRTQMKGRTVLTLIEIAYQEPSETNPAKLSKSLGIPPSTLSKEIKKLRTLGYINSHISDQVLNDGRFRNFAITPKGVDFLSILKVALKITIDRVKEKDPGGYA